MIRILALIFATAVVVQCQFNLPSLQAEQKKKSKTRCEYKYDQNSPFFWTGVENICTEELCQTYPDLDCYLPRHNIMSNVHQHKSENITREVAFLQKYFDTFIPRSGFKNKDYRCSGVCAKEPQLVERVFHDAEYKDSYTGVKGIKRTLCHVVGPKIYRTMCKGKCRLRYGGDQAYCVPDVSVSMDVWVFCPEVEPGCRKIRIDIPLSCSCRKIQCFKPPPEVGPFEPRLPDSIDPSFDPFADLFGPSTDATWTGPIPDGGANPPTSGILGPAQGKPSNPQPQNIPLWRK